MILESVRKLIEEKLNEKGYMIEKIEYLKEDGSNFLRIYIKKDGEIELEDCVSACRIINPILDDNDPIKESYILDVCSSGKGSEDNE